MKPVDAVRVTLKLPSTVGKLAERAGAIVMGIENHPELFPDPTPPLADVKADIATLVEADAAYKNRMGLMPPREKARLKLSSDVQQLHVYVQGVAKANPQKAGVIADAACMTLRKRPTHFKPELEIRQLLSGDARAVAKAIKGARSYDWQISTNGQETWNGLTPTTQAHTDVTGLTPGTVLWVRCRAITSRGALDWVSPVSRMIT